MDFEKIRQNLLNALANLLTTRVIVTSPHEKVADLPALLVLLAVLLCFPLSLAIIALGFICKYDARLEKQYR